MPRDNLDLVWLSFRFSQKQTLRPGLDYKQCIREVILGKTTRQLAYMSDMEGKKAKEGALSSKCAIGAQIHSRLWKIMYYVPQLREEVELIHQTLIFHCLMVASGSINSLTILACIHAS